MEQEDVEAQTPTVEVLFPFLEWAQGVLPFRVEVDPLPCQAAVEPSNDLVGLAARRRKGHQVRMYLRTRWDFSQTP
jgi:hypothetical protein